MAFAGPAFADFVRRDSVAFAAAVRDNLEAKVPSCPAWTVADLVNHLTEAHQFWRVVVERGVQDRRELDDLEPPTPLDPVRYFLDHALGFADLLVASNPETPVWTWSPRKNIEFIQRRMAHETAVHRWDAQLAAGDPHPIDGDLAADGVDEFFELFLNFDEPMAGTGEMLHIHRTDDNGEWLVRLTPNGPDVSHGHEKGDAAVRGAASDLMLLLWRRVGADDVEVFGDRALLNRFLAHAYLD